MKLDEFKIEDVKTIHVEWNGGGWTEFREVTDLYSKDDEIHVSFKAGTMAIINIKNARFIEFITRD